MAYIPGYKWDLFMSYPMEAESWTKRFEADLRDGTLLAAAKGLEVYLGRRDWPLGETSNDMLEAARRSAVFVVVLTKDSLAESQTRFLQREMAAFRESSSLKGRFCPIPLYPIEGSQLSRAIPAGNSDSFWNTNLEFFFHEDGIPLSLEPDTEPEPGYYKKQVKKVAHQLRHRLDEIKSGSRDAASKGAFFGRTVILAWQELKSSIEREWQNIQNLLANDGAAIIPEITLKADGVAEFEAAVRRADLFVQVFSASDKLDRAKAQLRAVESGRPIPILQWRKKHPNLKTDFAILESLDEEDRRFCEGANVQTGLLEDFKLEIRNTLEKIVIRDKLKKTTPPTPEKPYLYITADTPDLRLARQLQTAARKHTVADVMAQDEACRRQDFEEGLRQAAGVIFLHGNAERQFIELWLKEFIRKTRLLKIHPKLAALYQAPPEKAEEEEPMVPIEELRTEGSQKEFTLQGIEKICAELCSDPD